MFSSTRLSLKAKLLSSYLFCISCALAVGGAGVWGIDHLHDAYAHITTEIFPSVKIVSHLIAAQKDVSNIVATLTGVHASEKDLATQSERMADAEKNLEAAVKTYDKAHKEPAELEMWKHIKEKIAPFTATANKIIALSRTGEATDEAARDKLAASKFADLEVKVDADLDALVEHQSKEADKWSADAASAGTYARTLIFSISSISSVLALAFGMFLSYHLAKSLKGIASRLSSGADEVASASHQVAASSEQLSSSANEQAASLQETVASVEEMSAMIGKNADNARNSQGVSAQSSAAAERGKGAVADMIQAMDEINNSNSDIMRQIEDSNAKISEIVRVIAEIGNKTKVINDIVFQTKLLSFNASVEAARAGEHGKGFAVVAEEVGNLAQMSGAAAKEISSMLDGSIKKVEEIVAETKNKVEGLIQNGRSKIEKGTDVAKRCSEVLAEMVDSVAEVNRMVGEIAVASQEQSAGVQQINQAMGQLDQVTQQNASASLQASSAAESLTTQATQLRSMVSDLVRTVDGDNRALHADRQEAARVSKVGKDFAKIVSIDEPSRQKTVRAAAPSGKKAPAPVDGHGAQKLPPSRDNLRVG